MLVTDELRRVTRADVADPASERPTPSIVVADDLTIHLTDPEPIHVWSVLAFADPLSLGQESVFAITPDSLRTAQAAGFLPEPSRSSSAGKRARSCRRILGTGCGRC